MTKMIVAERQRVKVCELVSNFDRAWPTLFRESGPTLTAERIRLNKPDVHADEEARWLVTFAMWLWSGAPFSRPPGLDEMFEALGSSSLQRVGSLVAAIGEGVGGVDTWIAVHEGKATIAAMPW